MIEVAPEMTDGVSVIKVQTKAATGSGYWHREPEFGNNVRNNVDIKALDKYSLMVSANGVTGKLIRLGYF